MNVFCYLIFPGIAFFASQIVFVVYSQAAKMFEKSSETKTRVGNFARNKWLVRKVIAMRPARFSVGDQYYLKTSTKTTYYDATLKYSIDTIPAF